MKVLGSENEKIGFFTICSFHFQFSSVMKLKLKVVFVK